jgi:glycosyltransferase involved in cell wall biosynthesis
MRSIALAGDEMTLRRSVTILAPAYNEARNIEGAVRDAIEAASGLDEFEIIVVDDGSTDGTAEVVDRLALQIPQLRVIHHERNLGIGAAYRTALDAARMEYFAWTAGDRELHRDSLRDILAAIGSATVVIPYHGIPEQRDMHRRVLTWISTTQLNLMFGLRLHYYQGPAVFPTWLARALPMTSTGFYFATERLVHALAAGHSSVQVPLCSQNRTYGHSKAVSLANVFRAEWVIWRLWWRVRVRGKLAVPRVTPQATAALEGAE